MPTPDRKPEHDIVVRCPAEPPDLTPAVAMALLHLLVAVAESDACSGPGRDRVA